MSGAGSRYTSVWMGRPPVISESNCDTPLPEVRHVFLIWAARERVATTESAADRRGRAVAAPSGRQGRGRLSARSGTRDGLLPRLVDAEYVPLAPFPPSALRRSPRPPFCPPPPPGVITGRILEQVYTIRPTTPSAKRAALADLEARLDKWYAELPECLAYDTASKRHVPPPHILQLHMTYWNIVMLLHRALYFSILLNRRVSAR